MGNRGSKSDFNRSVKEQRVDGSWLGDFILFNFFIVLFPNITLDYLTRLRIRRRDIRFFHRVIFEYPPTRRNLIKQLKPSNLRCTLMGFERNYQIKIPSKQFNQKLYSTLNTTKEVVKSYFNNYLNPWVFTGFTDAEGCFNITIYRDSRSKLGWAVQLIFLINLHVKDRAILEQIKNTLGVGVIYINKNLPVASYKVKGIKDLQVIINHFNKYPLVTSKISSFLLFKQAFEIVKSGGHLTLNGLMEILSFKSALNNGLSDKLLKAFPNVLLLKAPDYKFKAIPHPMWVAGFTSGDGSFYIKINKVITGKVYTGLIYGITLHIKEKDLLIGLVAYFKSFLIEKEHIVKSNSNLKRTHTGVYYTANTVTLKFSNISNIVNIIIPFFDKYPLIGLKSFDFADFKKVSELIATKKHLTTEGTAEIEKINSTMNARRTYTK